MIGKLKSLLIFILFYQFATGFYCNEKINTNRQIDKLVLFSKFYGYIKYFHPSDEASFIDWDKFLLYSIGEVLNANTNHNLVEKLNHLFKPISPTLKIMFAKKDSSSSSNINIKNTTEEIAWQHFGVRLSEKSTTYKSGRVSSKADTSIIHIGLGWIMIPLLLI